MNYGLFQNINHLLKLKIFIFQNINNGLNFKICILFMF